MKEFKKIIEEYLIRLGKIELLKYLRGLTNILSYNDVKKILNSPYTLEHIKNFEIIYHNHKIILKYGELCLIYKYLEDFDELELEDFLFEVSNLFDLATS